MLFSSLSNEDFTAKTQKNQEKTKKLRKKRKKVLTLRLNRSII
ncbi:hypothetical protein Javan578_0004 [Streptococcus phage Javan578]|nr:hypothetical protein Javan566_0053 [Streptococcus phage Javan566]QBX30859.1 hypothetical protein Javan578_0004 [Streptococcus phage Javan578]